jgi:sialate O-acetylesterase
MRRVLLLALTLLSVTFPLAAQLKVARLFSDHLVLQRDKPIRIWGENTAGASVAVDYRQRVS